MRSMYSRQFALMACMVLLSFIVFGGLFVALSYHFTVQEKQAALERNAGFVADFTSASLAQGMSTENQFFQSYVSSIARISDTAIVLTNPDGRVVYVSDGTVILSAPQASVSSIAISSALSDDGYSGMSTLNGLFPEVRYVVGAPIHISVGSRTTTAGAVFVAAGTDSLTQLWRSLSGIFLFTAIFVLFIAFIASSLTSLRQTKPLKEMAAATRKFAHGEFDTRVDTHGRRDEIGELAEAFNAMAESLAQSEAQRSEFVANVSHELKTPMTTIAGFADGILDGTIPPEREQDALRTISAETRRLSRLVRRMLDLSRLQNAGAVTAQAPFDICELMARVLVSLETKINEKQLDVDANFPGSALMVWGDPDAITQVGYNLLDNAIKFSREGGRLGVCVSAKGGKACVTVSNEGDTIPPDELPLIFDRFHKTDHSRSADRDGVGLGLYIVKTILNTHKESISVTSEDGVTCFTFTLTQS